VTGPRQMQRQQPAVLITQKCRLVTGRASGERLQIGVNHPEM